MLSIGITLLIVFLTALSSAKHEQQLAIADLSFFSNTPPSVQISDDITALPLRGDKEMEQKSQALSKRDVTFGWYSHYYVQNHLYQWIFGNATNQFNISISTCINGSDTAGVYQFMNGSTSTTATVGDIYKDLGYGTALANPKQMMAHTLINAQAAYNDITTFLLDSILCSGNSLLKDDLRRQLLFMSDGFHSEGRVMTLILQAAGGMVAYFTWNGIGLLFDNPGIKTLFGGIATLNLILVLGILEILRQEGYILRKALFGFFTSCLRLPFEPQGMLQEPLSHFTTQTSLVTQIFLIIGMLTPRCASI